MFKREFHFFRKDSSESNAMDISLNALNGEMRFPLLRQTTYHHRSAHEYAEERIE